MADDYEPYLEPVQAVRENANQNLRLSLNASVDSQPDAEAKLNFFANKYGLPVDSVRDNKEEVERRSAVDDVAHLAAGMPSTAAALSDPKVARIAHDDVDNMTGIEGAIRGISNFNWNIGSAFSGGFNQLNIGLVGLLKAPSELGKQIGDVTGLSRLQFQWQRDSYNRYMGALDRYSGQQQALLDYHTPKTDNPVLSGVYSGVQSLPNTLGTLALAATGAGPVASSVFAAAPVGGQAYVQARGEGLDPASAVLFGGEQGTVEYFTEKIGVDQFLKGAGKGFIAQVARTLAAEVPGEQVATIMQDFNEWAALPSNADKPFSAYLKERPNAAFQTAVATVVGTGAGAITVRGTQSAAYRIGAHVARGEQAKHAQQQAETLTALTKLAAASKVRARDPKAFDTFIAQAAQDGPVQDIFIDATHLDAAAAASPEAAEVLNQLPSVQAQMEQARISGGDVSIPVEEFTRLADTPAAEALIPHVRTEPDGFTQAEAEVYMQEHGPKLQNEIAQILSEQSDDAAFVASRDAVQANMFEQLQKASRFTPDVNKLYADFHSLIIGNFAKRLGITPEEFHARYPMGIAAQSPAGGEQLDQSDKTPEFHAWHDGSQVVDENGQAKVVYHGAMRGDRIDAEGQFRADRATSGPMQYFTENPELASSYAAGKPDNSFDGMHGDEKLWTINGKNLDEAWAALPAETRARIRSAGHEIGLDDDGNVVKGNDHGGFGKDTWDHYLRDRREGGGNGLRALHKLWIESGMIFDAEHKFKDVLKAFGVEGVEYDDPGAQHSSVFPVYLSIKNPLDAGNIPPEVLAALREAAKNQPEPEFDHGVDMWDKRALSPSLFMERLEDSSFGMTVVPDWASDVLRAFGYDGIKDTGGKMGGEHHTVWVPFDPTQIKSIFNDGTFNPADPDILHQSMPEAYYSALERAVEDSKTTKAPAAQWAATLQKTPGIKKEEIEWSGILDWLAYLEGPVTREDVLAFVKNKGVQVEEHIYSEDGDSDSDAVWDRARELDEESFDRDYTAPDYEVRTSNGEPLDNGVEYLSPEWFAREEEAHGSRSAWFEQPAPLPETPERDTNTADLFPDAPAAAQPQRFYVFDSDAGISPNDGEEYASQEEAQAALDQLLEEHRDAAWQTWDEDGPSDWARQQAEEERGNRTKWSSYKVDGADDTYHEMILTLPQIEGPATHWDEPNVVAHVRFTTRRGADGSKVLFLEEVQSDWHQKGRKQGYKIEATPEQQAAIRAEFDARVAERNAQLADLLAKTNPLMDQALDRQKAVLDKAEAEKDAAVAEQERIKVELRNAEHPDDAAALFSQANEADNKAEVARRVYDRAYDSLNFLRDRVDRARGQDTGYSSRTYPVSEQIPALYALLNTASYMAPELVNLGPQAGELMEASEALNAVTLRTHEAMQAYENSMGHRGIPDAPFKTSYPQLILKRMIAWAADNGHDQIAWITGDQQNGGSDRDEQGDWFYGRNLPNLANDLLKKHGVKVEPLKVQLPGFETSIDDADDDTIAELNRLDDAAKNPELERRLEEARTAWGETSQALREARAAQPPLTREQEANYTPDPAILELADAHSAAEQRFHTLLEGQQQLRLNYKNALAAAKMATNLGFKITPELKAAAESGFALFQEARGSFNPTTNLVTLLKGADLSTFLHESGHFYLEVLTDLASQVDAPQDITNDMAAVLKWLGVPSLGDWRQMSLSQKREAHEKFARGFEAFLFEGKAPSQETTGMFQRFRAWMVSVYRHLSALNVELNDDIRAVFGRLMASDQQIAEHERAQGYTALFETKPDTMSDDEWANYQKLGAQATQDAVHALEARSVRDMKWLSGARARVIRRLQAEASEKRKAIKAEVTAEVAAEPVNRARTFLKRGWLDGAQAEGPHRLNIDDVKALYDHLPEELRDYTKLGYGKYGMLSAEGLHPDEVAEMFGYPSGEVMIEDLLSAEDPHAKIKGMTDQRMLERYGDLTDDQAIERAADEALHNDARLKFVAAEAAALAKAAGGRKILNKAAKDFAAQIVGRLTLKKLKPNRFSAAERRAAVRAAEAHGKGELVTAATEKRNQLINGYATRAAHDAVAEVEKAKVLFRRIVAGKDEALARTRDMDFVNAARAVLSAYGVGRAKNNPEHYMKLLREYDPAMADLLEPMVADAAASAKPLDEATVDELRALRDTVNQLWFLSRRVRQMEIDGQLYDRGVIAAELGGRLDALGVPDRSGEIMGLTEGEKRVRSLSGVRAALRRVEHWVRHLDGADKGPFRKFLWQPISEAADRYRSDRLHYITALREIMRPIAETLKVVKIAAPELGITFGTGARGVGKSQLLHAILHTGNESNKRKLLLGRGWATERADGTLDTSKWDAFIDRMHRENVLTKADYDFAQAVWDLLEQTKPGAQKAHRAVVGRYFSEVTADAFDTPFGTYRGGYVPATVDTDVVQDAKVKQAEENLTAASQSSMFPSPSKGFTMSRVEYNKPLELDLSLLPRHLDKVLKFTHFAAPTQDAVRLLGAKGFSAKLEAFDPEAKTELLLPWLNRASKQITETAPGSKAGQAFANFARAINSRTGLGIMFGNLTNALQQLTGWSVSAVLVKPRHLAGGLVNYTRDPMGSTQRVREASPFMATRTDNQLYDVETHIRDILLNPGVVEQSQRWSSKHGYFLQSAFQNVVDVSTWIGAYNEATERGDEDRDAIRHADSVVRLTQGSMAPEDVSQFEAGSPFVKLFTKFQGYFNNMANLLGTEFGSTMRDLGLRKGAGKMLYIYTLGFAIPAIMSQAIVDLMHGGWDDDDNDGYLDSLMNLLFGSQLRFALGLAPVAGPIGNTILNALDNKAYNDRISISPAISLIESAAKAPKEIYKAIVDGSRASPAIKDTLSLLTLATGIPLTILGKPLGYGADVAQGKVEPTGPVDMARGLVTGAASPKSKVH